MAEIKTIIKLQIPAGKATPAPPVGPALGQHSLNIMGFCTQFNEATKERGNEIVPVEITVYSDNSFDIQYKTPPAAELLKKAAKIEKGAADPLRNKVGKITQAQIRQIAEQKLEDLNAYNLEQAEKIIKGTARSMGIEII